MTIQQIRSSDGTGTLSYLIVDETTRLAAVIDPNKEDAAALVNTIAEQHVSVRYIIDTHTHADHISGARELKASCGGETVMHEQTKNKWKFVDQGDAFGIGDILRANAAVNIDLYVNDGDTLPLGKSELRILYTPGHTDNHISVFADGNLFTGDLLLIGQAGRTDLPGGSAEEQFDSFKNKILPLPDSTRIYPGHDYEGNESSLLFDEKRTNPFLQQKTKEGFLTFVADFFPPIADSVQNGKMLLQCGVKRVQSADDRPVRDLSPDQLETMMQKDLSLTIIDVREPKELTMFGHIPNIKNISSRQMGNRLNELPSDKSKPIVIVCQTGARSAEISRLLMKNGYSDVFNLSGGTLGWIMSGKKIVRTAPEPTKSI